MLWTLNVILLISLNQPSTWTPFSQVHRLWWSGHPSFRFEQLIPHLNSTPQPQASVSLLQTAAAFERTIYRSCGLLHPLLFLNFRYGAVQALRKLRERVPKHGVGIQTSGSRSIGEKIILKNNKTLVILNLSSNSTTRV